ncbi:MAG: RsmB/NOP family class I SAM-dependent RNA methyltransferase [Methanothrix sp.]|nr:RsmB/NOP family class I SAM-dependent RNA methyltransferase [Methanothrix sp.]
MDYLDRYREIVPDYDAFQAIQCLPLYNSARINTLKIKREKLLERLEEEGVLFQSFHWYPLGLKLDIESPGKLLENLQGFIHIQEELSMVPPLVLDPQPGESILDLCASPGSKTTQISQMMENRGLVIANEPSLARVSPLRSNCERLGVINVAITRYDGRNFPRGPFDRVLVDAPCSSEGRERRGPGVLSRCSTERSLDLQILQIDLLKNALRLTKPGGIVVYSTCTYAPEENELVVQEALGEAEEFRLEKVCIPGLLECPGITEWNGQRLNDPGITEWNGQRLNDDLSCTARYYPHINDTGGFYVAKIIKN